MRGCQKRATGITGTWSRPWWPGCYTGFISVLQYVCLSLGTEVQALACHCGSGLIVNSKLCVCGLNLLLLHSDLQSFFQLLWFFPSPQYQAFNLIWLDLVWYAFSSRTRALECCYINLIVINFYYLSILLLLLLL